MTRFLPTIVVLRPNTVVWSDSMADIDDQGNRVVITIDRDTLIYAVDYYNDMNPNNPVRITDLDALWKSFVNLLHSEDDNGDDAVNRMLDRVLQMAIEYSGEGIEELENTDNI